jgi:3-hydroxybutyryl-CoA dehydratase
MNIADYSFNEIVVGQKASFSRRITKKDVATFAKLSGDRNPLHEDKSYAKTTPFKKPIVHGMLLGALCSTLVGMHLPGKRSLYLYQSLEFKKPVYPGDTLRVVGLVRAKSASTQIIELGVTFHRGRALVARGTAKVRML